MNRILPFLVFLLLSAPAWADGIVNGGSSSIVVGTTPIVGGVDDCVLYETGTSVAGCDSGFTYAGSGGQVKVGSAGSVTAPALAVGTSSYGFYQTTNNLLVSIAGLGGFDFQNSSGNPVLVLSQSGQTFGQLLNNGGTMYVTNADASASLILRTNSAAAMTIAVGGGLTFNGSTYANCTALTTSSNVVGCTASDARLKSIGGDLDPQEALAFATSVDAKFYTFKDEKNVFSDDRKHIGFLAQDVNRLAPHIASAMVRMMAPTDETPDGTLALDYDQTGVIALMAVRALSERLDRLEASR